MYEKIIESQNMCSQFSCYLGRDLFSRKFVASCMFFASCRLLANCLQPASLSFSSHLLLSWGECKPGMKIFLKVARNSPFPLPLVYPHPWLGSQRSIWPHSYLKNDGKFWIFVRAGWGGNFPVAWMVLTSMQESTRIFRSQGYLHNSLIFMIYYTNSNDENILCHPLEFYFPQSTSWPGVRNE